MHSRSKNQNDSKAKPVRHPSNSTMGNNISKSRKAHPDIIIQRAMREPQSLTRNDVLQLQQTIGNQAVGQLLSGKVKGQANRGGDGSVGARMARLVQFGRRGNTPVHNVIQEEKEPGVNPADNGRLNSNLNPGRFVTTVIHHKIPFSASIRRVKDSQPEAPNRNAGNPHSYNDSEPGEEQEASINPESIPIPVLAPISEPEVGETIKVPDITIDVPLEYNMMDSIASNLTYTAAITQGGPAPTGFGKTRPGRYTLTGTTITNASSTFNVTATVDNPISYQVRATTGPRGQVDIASDTDSDITAANYNTVATDLTPNMSRLNGRPPRNSFWARDLTIRHELFHANDHAGYGRQGITQAQTWLNSQTASNATEVNVLLARVPGRVAAVVRTGMAYPARERRAYGDGAPSYRTRANSISAKGGRGEYP